MNRFVVASLFISIVSGTVSASEIIVVPLEVSAPGLFLFGGDDHRLDFDVEHEIPDLTDARLRISGKYSLARSVCWNFGDFGGGVWTYGERAGFVMGFGEGETADCITVHELPSDIAGIVDFEIEIPFDCEGGDWSFLAEGAGTVRLTGLSCEYFPSYPEVCICERSAEVSAASLILEQEAAVAVEGNTWGAFKARYR